MELLKNHFLVKTYASVKLFKPFGKNLSNKVKKLHIENAGMSRFYKIWLYLKWTGIKLNKIKVDEMCFKLSDLEKNKVINSTWIHGMEAFLKNNKKKHIYIIVSDTPQNKLEDICWSLNINDYFSKIYGSATSKRDAIKNCIQYYKIPSEKCLMIGDALADIHAAKKIM